MTDTVPANWLNFFRRKGVIAHIDLISGGNVRDGVVGHPKHQSIVFDILGSSCSRLSPMLTI